METPDVKALLRELGLLHGRTAHARNGEEQARGRKVFFRAVERAMRSDRHYWATLNYVHHNPVRHGKWRAGKIGRGAAQRSIWRKQVLKRLSVSGRRIRCATTERIGTSRDVRPHECGTAYKARSARVEASFLRGGTPNLSRACVLCAPFRVIASRRRASLGAQAADCAPYLFAFPFRGKAPQWGFVFTLMTLELGLVPLPLYARNR